VSEALRGRVVIVTGASSGIGAATAKMLSEKGAKAALAARREDALREVQAGLAAGADSLVYATDVTDRGLVEALVERTEDDLGPVDALVNCAGVMYYTMMKNVCAEEWDRTVEVNCKGALNCVGAVLPGMMERGRGHIVTISSDAERVVFPGLAIYSASRFFVEALSKGLRMETAGTGIKVTTVQPGNVATDLLDLSGDEEALEEYGQPTGARMLDPEDVAASVAYALSQPEHVAVNEVLVEPRDEPA